MGTPHHQNHAIEIRLVYTGVMAPKDWGPPSPLPLQNPYRSEYYIHISFPKTISTVQWCTE
jgi:hypothetical protein